MVDFHCRVNFTSVTHVYLTGFTYMSEHESEANIRKLAIF